MALTFPFQGFAASISIQVKGMVCSFCAQGIEKKFKAQPEIESIRVSLETKKVDLETKHGKDLTDAEIEKLIKESGYSLVKIERTP